jgi:hypothetical protein
MSSFGAATNERYLAHAQQCQPSPTITKPVYTIRREQFIVATVVPDATRRFQNRPCRFGLGVRAKGCRVSDSISRPGVRSHANAASSGVVALALRCKPVGDFPRARRPDRIEARPTVKTQSRAQRSLRIAAVQRRRVDNPNAQNTGQSSRAWRIGPAPETGRGDCGFCPRFPARGLIADALQPDSSLRLPPLANECCDQWASTRM